MVRPGAMGVGMPVLGRIEAIAAAGRQIMARTGVCRQAAEPLTLDSAYRLTGSTRTAGQVSMQILLILRVQHGRLLLPRHLGI